MAFLGSKLSGGLVPFCFKTAASSFWRRFFVYLEDPIASFDETSSLANHQWAVFNQD